MGQASRRGTFEERKAQAIARKEEQQRMDQEAFVGTGGFGSGRRRGSSMMLMAAMLAATAGIGSVMADD